MSDTRGWLPSSSATAWAASLRPISIRASGRGPAADQFQTCLCLHFYTLSSTGRYGTAERVLAMAILSVCPSVRPSDSGTDSSPREIETPGLHHMIA